MQFFSFNLELIYTCEFFKKRNCTRQSSSCNFSFLKNSLVQINSKLNSKPYDYLYKLSAPTPLPTPPKNNDPFLKCL